MSQAGSVGGGRVTNRNLDSVRPHLLPQAFGESSDRVLAPGVGRVAVQAHEPEHRRHIGDVAGTRPDEFRQRGTGHPHHPEVVHRQHVLERLHGQLPEMSRVSVASVADDDVEPAQPLARRCHAMLNGSLVADVHLDRMGFRAPGSREFLRRGFKPVAGPGGDADVGSRSERTARCREPDACGTARDEDVLACETTHRIALRQVPGPPLGSEVGEQLVEHRHLALRWGAVRVKYAFGA